MAYILKISYIVSTIKFFRTRVNKAKSQKRKTQSICNLNYTAKCKPIRMPHRHYFRPQITSRFALPPLVVRRVNHRKKSSRIFKRAAHRLKIHPSHHRSPKFSSTFRDLCSKVNLFRCLFCGYALECNYVKMEHFSKIS